MKKNRLIWGAVSIFVLLTLAVSFGTIGSHSQQNNSKKQINGDQQNLTKYAVVDYDTPEYGNAIDQEERKLKNKRYDNQKYFVRGNPHPETKGTTIFDETPPSPVIPVTESDLVMIGEIVDVNAHLSNDKGNVYSEYAVRVEEILKGIESNKLARKGIVNVDRTGGYVRYSNGQKVLYKIAGQGLPEVGARYVFFLTTDKQSPNYKILTGYELKQGKVTPLDTATSFSSFDGISDLNFIKAIRNKIKEFSNSANNEGELHEK